MLYHSEKLHYLAYFKAGLASDMYAYGLTDSARKRWVAHRHRQVVHRWLEATQPPIISPVAQVHGSATQLKIRPASGMPCGTMLAQLCLL